MVPGFWDGNDATGATMRVRFAFPPPSSTNGETWSFSTSCTNRFADAGGACGADANLHGYRGTVLVTPAAGGTNRLYQYGFLKVDAAGRTLRFATQPASSLDYFQWLGDSPWGAPMNAVNGTGSAGTWKKYVDDRQSRGFTALQMTPTYKPQPGATLPPFTDAANQPPFVTSTPACRRWNPDFWKNLDWKVQYANDHGLVVLFTGLATVAFTSTTAACGELIPAYAQPVDQCPYDGNATTDPNNPTDEVRIFARNFVARNAGNFVMFSPGNDTHPTASANNPAAEKVDPVGKVIRAAASGVAANGTPLVRQLVTTHIGGSTEAALYDPFFAKPWLDFVMAQSGPAQKTTYDEDCPPNNPPAFSLDVQLDKVTERARTLPLYLYERPAGSVIKPLFNGETVYDYGPFPTGTLPDPLENNGVFRFANHNDYRTRQTGYLSILSGAFGYSFGTRGVWDWSNGTGDGVPARSYSHSLLGAAEINRRASDQVQRLGALVRGISNWQRVKPNHAKIVDNDPRNSFKMVLAHDTNWTYAVAYLPHNQSITFNRNNFACIQDGNIWTKQWFNPRSGEFSDATNCTNAGLPTNQYKCTIPINPIPGPGLAGASDFVLVLRKIATTTSCGQVSAILQTHVERDAQGISGNLVGAIVEESGKTVVGPFVVSAQVPSAGRDSTGDRKRNPVAIGDRFGEFLAAWEELADDGSWDIRAVRIGADGVPLGDELVIAEGAGDEGSPVVAVNSAGNYLVAWAANLEGSLQLLVRRVDSESGLGPPVQVSASSQDGLGFVQAVGLASGEFLFAWESIDPGDASTSIRGQRLSPAGELAGPQFLVTNGASGARALYSVEAGLAGDFTITWESLGPLERPRFLAQAFSASGEKVGEEALVRYEDQD